MSRLNRDAEITGTFITRADRFCSLLQAEGEKAVKLHAGDVVNIPPEVKHWHGAAKDSVFVHLAVEVPAEEAYNEWLEPVSDEAYNNLE